MDERRFKKRNLFLLLYIVFALLPIYWMVNMSFRTNQEILSSFSLFPAHPTWDNYATIFTDPSWYSGYINSLIYVAINTVISLTVALPAAYAFSRYSFLGDKHVFFWLLTNRMTPPAVFLLPFFQLYSTVGLMDTHIAVAMAHLLFNVPLAVWILEGFMCVRHGLGHLGGRRRADHRARRHRPLVCAALHRQRLCHGACMNFRSLHHA